MQLIQAKGQIVESLIIMSGEIDMKMLAHNNKMKIAVLLCTVFGFAGCGKAGTPSVAAETPTVQVAVMEEGGDQRFPVVVEHRHFAIYSTYRMLSDDSANALKPHGNAREEGLQHAAASDLAACSIHADLMPAD